MRRSPPALPAPPDGTVPLGPCHPPVRFPCSFPTPTRTRGKQPSEQADRGREPQQRAPASSRRVVGGCGGWAELGWVGAPSSLRSSPPVNLEPGDSPSLLSPPCPARSSSAVNSHEVAPTPAKWLLLRQGRALLSSKLKRPDEMNTKSCVLRNHNDSNTSFLSENELSGLAVLLIRPFYL